MISSTWTQLHKILTNDGQDHSFASRLANLVLAAAISDSAEKRRRWTRASLNKRVQSLARHPLATSSLSTDGWRHLTDALNEINVPIATPDVIDGWVEAFQSAGRTRKQLGAFATPSVFAKQLAENTLSELVRRSSLPSIVDPSCGAGALLIACLDVLAPDHGDHRARAVEMLHGMEIDETARELCCLLLWIAAGPHLASLDVISRNVTVDNAVTHDWWDEKLPFDVLIMNPPWESLRHATDPADPHAAQRNATIDRLTRTSDGQAGLPPLFTAQGRGDRNLFKAFMELAPHLIREGGRAGILVPAAFASDDGMAHLRRRYFEQFSIERWTSFENRAKHFAIDSRYKFGLLTGTRSSEGTTEFQARAFCVDPEETSAPHVLLTKDDLRRVGGPGAMILELSSPRELAILETMLASGSPFFEGGSLGSVTYRREIDLSLGRAKGHFEPLADREAKWTRSDVLMVDGRTYVPVVEGRMVGQYDCFQKSWLAGFGRKALWRDNGRSGLAGCRPQFIATPSEANAKRVALCDVTSSTNTRTVLATMLPETWLCGNTAPTLNFQSLDAARAALVVLNSMTFDWMARRIVAGLHLNRFYLESLVWPLLSLEDVEWLSQAAVGIGGCMPRANVPGSIDHAAIDDRATLLAAVEVKVAECFGLGADELAFMFDGDRSLRRGFWRFYDSDPDARRVAQLAVTSIRKTRLAQAA